MYDVCDNTSYLSVYSNLFLLMAQALISRVFTPGMSNFVNASVRNLMLANRLVLHNPTQILNSDSGSRRRAHDCLLQSNFSVMTPPRQGKMHLLPTLERQKRTAASSDACDSVAPQTIDQLQASGFSALGWELRRAGTASAAWLLLHTQRCDM